MTTSSQKDIINDILSAMQCYPENEAFIIDDKHYTGVGVQRPARRHAGVGRACYDRRDRIPSHRAQRKPGPHLLSE